MNEDGDTSDNVIRYYNISSGITSNTGAVGSFFSINGNIIAFSTYEGSVDVDLNGDGDTWDSVIRYYTIPEAPPPPLNLISTTVEIENIPPTVDDITFYSDAGRTQTTSSFNPSPGDNTTVYVRAAISDQNGYADISNIYAYFSYNETAPNGTILNSTNLGWISLTFEMGSGTTASYIGEVNLTFYNISALGNFTYNLTVTAFDFVWSGGGRSSGYHYQELTALNLNATNINFGNILMGQNSSIQNVQVQNYGNVRIDLQLSGTDMVRTGGGGMINVSNVYHRNPPTSFVSTMTSPVTFNGFDLDAGSYSVNVTEWKLYAPMGVLAGTYTGNLSFVAIKG